MSIEVTQTRIAGQRPALRSRAKHPETFNELSRNMSALFPDGNISPMTPHQLATASADSQFVSGKTTRWEARSKALMVGIADATIGVERGLCITLNRTLGESDLAIANAFARVFNNDVENAPDFHADKELWLSLQQTRFSRAIGRYAPFHTDHFVRWLRTFENAGSLRYENKPFTTHLVLTTQLYWVSKNPAVSFVKFGDRIPLNRALFDEKWIRALSFGGEVGLVGLGHNKGIAGAMRLNKANIGPTKLIPPHESLTELCEILVPGTMALVASQQGDIYVLFPSGGVFQKTQGHWSYLNPRLLESCLSKVADKVVATKITRLALDLSYERRGALFVIPKNKSDAYRLIADHGRANRVNRDLRLFAVRLDLKDDSHRQILRNIAAIDGAVIIATDGKVIDAACMIGAPPINLIQAAGQSTPKAFAGARTTAAWNGSFYGLTVKVSEDGPITVFENGNRILQMG